MKLRAETEGVEWKLNELYLDEWFNDGCRQFFGVILNAQIPKMLRKLILTNRNERD